VEVKKTLGCSGGFCGSFRRAGLVGEADSVVRENAISWRGEEVGGRWVQGVG